MLNNKILGMAAVVLVLAACGQESVEAPVAIAEPEVVAAPMSETVDVSAGETDAPKDMVVLEAIDMHSAVFTVDAINHETRVATLKNAEGELLTITASAEAKNLDQVQAGSQVLAEFIKTVTVELAKGESLEPTVVLVSESEHAEKGEVAAAAELEAVVVIFNVEEINLENNTFKLKDPNGIVTEYTAQKPENLKKASVGDSVILTVVEAVAISLVVADVAAE